MAAPRQYIVHHDSLSEYMYRLMKKVPREEVERMPAGKQKIFESEKSINNFCKNETLDRLIRMATDIGIDWMLLLGPDEEGVSQSLFNVFNQHQFAQKRLDAIDAMKRGQIYALSSREDMVLAMMAAQNAQTSVYHLSEFSKDLVKTGREFNKIPTYGEEMAMSSQAYSQFVRYALEVLNAEDFRITRQDLTDLNMRILLTLFSKKNSAVDLKEVAEGTGLLNKVNYLKRDIENLIEKKLIISDATKGKKVHGKPVLYMITSQGIKKVMEYVEYIGKKAFVK